MHLSKRYCHNRFGPTFCDTMDELITIAPHEKQRPENVNFHVDKHFDELIHASTNMGTGYAFGRHDRAPHSNSEKIKDIITPIFFNAATKPTATEVSAITRERAILNQASRKYEGHNKEAVERYLGEHGLHNKYKVHYGLSTNDGLVFVDKRSNKATIAFRGTDPQNKQDWYENYENMIKHTTDPTKTNYYKRLREMYENTAEKFEVEHLTGYSKGGFGAYTLGEMVKTPTTLFNPSIGFGNLNMKPSGTKHQIVNITEDIVSIGSYPLRAKNPNVEILTLDPLKKFDTFNPLKFEDGPHDLNNIIFTDERRSSHDLHLGNESVKTSKHIGELEYTQNAKHIIERGGSFTDFIASVDTADVIPSDNNEFKKLGPRIKRNTFQHQIWKELGGQFTHDERLHLASAPSSNYEPATTIAQRTNFLNMRQPARTQMIDNLMEHLDSVNTAQSKHEQQTKPIKDIIRRAYMSAVSDYSSVDSTSLKEDVNMKIEEIKQQARREGVSVKGGLIGLIAYYGGDKLLGQVFDVTPGLRENLTNEQREVVDAFTLGSAGALLTGASTGLKGTSMAGGATVLGYEAAKSFGNVLEDVTKRYGFDDTLALHTKLVGEGIAGGTVTSATMNAPSVLKTLGASALTFLKGAKMATPTGAVSTFAYEAARAAGAGAVLAEGMHALDAGAEAVYNQKFPGSSFNMHDSVDAITDLLPSNK